MLSRKIRNIRWKWNKKSNKQKRPNDEKNVPAKKRKAPRVLMDLEDAGPDMEEDGAVELMKEQLAKPEKDQEKPLILKAQRVTFKTRRKFTRSLEDATVKDITEKYPILKVAKYMEKEFFLMKPDLSQKFLEDKWTELLQHLDGIFHDAEDDKAGSTEDEKDCSTEDENLEVLKLMFLVQDSVKFCGKTSKKEVDLITKIDVKDLKLSSKAKSPPRLVVALNENGSINSCFIIGDGVEISVGNDIKTVFQMLLMAYYVFDLSYPKKYQLLGFLQMAVFQDDAPFFKGTNYLKFKKVYDDHKSKVDT